VAPSPPTGPAGLFRRPAGRRRQPLPRPPLPVVVAVFAGGFAGGLARYLLTVRWPTPAGRFPWTVLAVNTSGAYLLALLVVLVGQVWPPTRYVRPALGTGFLGAYTTFSAVTVATTRLARDGHLATAAAYLGGGTLAGLVAALLGALTGRTLAARRPQTRTTSSGGA